MSVVPAGASILEVGCGPGHLAAALAASGYRVTALDENAECIRKARRRAALGNGAGCRAATFEAVRARWPEYDGPRVDAIAFTRSLHHIEPLAEAVAAAFARLKPGGSLLLEDFAYDEVDPQALLWFRDLLRSDAMQRAWRPVEGTLATEVAASRDPRGVWRRHHDHGLHSFPVMRESIRSCASAIEESEAPYLYRYLVQVLPAAASAAGIMAQALAEESRLIREGRFLPVGRRLLASTALRSTGGRRVGA